MEASIRNVLEAIKCHAPHATSMSVSTSCLLLLLLLAAL